MGLLKKSPPSINDELEAIVQRARSLQAEIDTLIDRYVEIVRPSGVPATSVRHTATRGQQCQCAAVAMLTPLSDEQNTAAA